MVGVSVTMRNMRTDRVWQVWPEEDQVRLMGRNCSYMVCKMGCHCELMEGAAWLRLSEGSSMVIAACSIRSSCCWCWSFARMTADEKSISWPDAWAIWAIADDCSRSVEWLCWTSVALMFRYAFMQWSRGLSAISRWAVFARDLIYDIAGLRCWLTRLSAGKKITKILVGCACWRNWVPFKDAANLLVDVRIVRYKDFDRILIGLGGCGCRKINRLLSSVHDMGNA